MTPKTVWSALLALDLATTILTPLDTLATLGGIALGATARAAWRSRSTGLSKL